MKNDKNLKTMKNFHKITITYKMSANFSTDVIYLLSAEITKASALEMAKTLAGLGKNFVSPLTGNSGVQDEPTIKIEPKSYKRVPSKYFCI